MQHMRGNPCRSSFALHKIKKERRVLNLILCKALAQKTTARIKNGIQHTNNNDAQISNLDFAASVYFNAIK